MNRDSFVFYRSFFECIRELPPKERDTLFMALCEYALDKTEPSLKGLCAGIFGMMRPQIDANNRKWENGIKGGRPKRNQRGTGEEPKNNQTETTGCEKDRKTENHTRTGEEPNVNDNDNVNDNEIPPISPTAILEQFLSVYPLPDKQINRHLAETAYTDCLMTGQVTEQELLLAAQNYADRCRILETDSCFVKKPENFLRDLEYCQYLPGVYEPPKKPKGKNANQGMLRQDYGDMKKLEKELLSN